MIRIRKGQVKNILSQRDGIQEIGVSVEGKEEKAIVYTEMSGKVNVGDRVLINTTACYLGLGTGGYHFVIANTDRAESDLSGAGHIMKLRYTPMQLKCLSVEEQQSSWHQKIKDFTSLEGFPVITATLHSMLAPMCAFLKKSRPESRIAYIMTDGAALPIAFSRTVWELKEKHLLDISITCGNAFGGDMEAVNFYTGIIAAREAAGCDVAIVAMGPGIVGTGTAYGFSGIEQGCIIDGINTLGGTPVAAARISFADVRERHRGISHHTIKVLGSIAKTRALVALPVLARDKVKYIKQQVEAHDLHKKHRVVYKNGEEIFSAMRYYGLRVTTMGRGVEDDPDFFLSLGAAAKAAIQYID